jgi:hypothetical protein
MTVWQTTENIPRDRPILVRSMTAPFGPVMSDGSHVTVGQRSDKGLWTKDGLFADCDPETGSSHFTHWADIPAFDA